jgi:hypothetical protein
LVTRLIPCWLPASAQRGVTSLSNQPSYGGVAIRTLQTKIQDLRNRLVSTCVTMGNLIFTTLEFTTKWITLEFPQDPDAALICVDAVTLFYSIGIEFATTSGTQYHIYQNKKAGLSILSLVLHSSFQTLLP